MAKKQDKIKKVMEEYKEGELRSGSKKGPVVKNPKQAIAIALSEAKKSKPMKKGGEMKESKTMMKKEVSFMKKKGAPKSMVKHEMAEAGMEAGGVSKKLPSPKQMGNLGMKAGGLAAGHKSANGVAKRGLTKGTMVKMAKGGSTKKYC
mgnify:CR=1 FL=1